MSKDMKKKLSGSLVPSFVYGVKLVYALNLAHLSLKLWTSFSDDF